MTTRTLDAIAIINGMLCIYPLYGGDNIHEIDVPWEMLDNLEQDLPKYSHMYFLELAIFGSSNYMKVEPELPADYEVLKNLQDDKE